jgi:hypothetical protein
MARTGENENKQANQQYSAIEQDQINRANAATSQFNDLLGKMRNGQQIAKNPYDDPAYNREQNIMTAGATSSTNKGTQELLDTQALRTGSNTGARKATIADLGRQRMRTATELTAGRKADDYDRYLDWQKFILGSTLAPANVDTSLFQSAVGGRNNSLGNLTELGKAGYDMWGNIISSGLQAAGTVASGGLSGGKGGQKPCWIAMAIWGDDDLRTLVVREWLCTEFVKSRFGKFVMSLYLRFGQRVAEQVRKRSWVKRMFKPVFELALGKAMNWKLETK